MEQHRDIPDLVQTRERIDSLRQRLLDTAVYLRGITAIVESMNKGAADGLDVAIHAIEAVSDDLQDVCGDTEETHVAMPTLRAGNGMAGNGVANDSP